MRPPDEMEGEAADGETASRHLSRRRARSGQGDEVDRGAPATFGDPADVRHHHQTESDQIAGKGIVAGRLTHRSLSLCECVLRTSWKGKSLQDFPVTG